MLQVSANVFIFTMLAGAVYELNERLVHIDLGVEVAPYEVAGVALGLLLVLRTNAGYDRWWEGRKLWGAIVNDCRALATTALAHGPADRGWRASLVHWVAAFPHATRHSLRFERKMPELQALLGTKEADRLMNERHIPTSVSMRIALVLREGCERFGMDRRAFLAAENARNKLIDHMGGCERILKTPLPKVYSINIRRFILLFLGTLPFALLPKLGRLTPVVELLVAYPILALDEIGVELQNPFSRRNLGHLPLDDICALIEADVKALGGEKDLGTFRNDERLDNLLADG
jgi:putative membrane protein